MGKLKEEIEAAYVWSTLCNTPVILRIKPYDKTIVFWNGILLSKRYMALVIASIWANIYPTNAQKQEIKRDFLDLSRHNFTEDSAELFSKYVDQEMFNEDPNKVLSYLLKKIRGNYAENLQVMPVTTLTEAMEWLKFDNEKVVDLNDEVQF
jgi:hypothetical protein